MAAVASLYQTSELMQNLSIESENRTLDQFSGIQFGSGNGVQLPTNQISSAGSSMSSVLPDYAGPNSSYLSNRYSSPFYYYGALDGSVNEWGDYSRYSEGIDVPRVHGVYGGDVGQQGYGIGPFGSVYSSSSSVPTMDLDNQMYGAQLYQRNSSFLPNQAALNGSFPSINTAPQMDSPVGTIEAINPNSSRFTSGSIIGNNDSLLLNQCQQNPLLTSNGPYERRDLFGGNFLSGCQNSGFGFDGMRSSASWLDGPTFSDGFVSSLSNSLSSIGTNFDSSRNLIARPAAHQLMGYNASRPATNSIMNSMYPSDVMQGQYGHGFRSGGGFRSNMHQPRTNDRWGFSDGKYNKPRNRRHGNGFYGFANENFDGLSELNRGPREFRLKNYRGPLSSLGLATNGQSLLGSIENPALVPNIEQYNRADFSETYSEAKFFVIKSYSEDDVHKSIKYSVWASTPNGNKKLDAAYNEAKGKATDCPVFLFFSVNASGQFLGIAEMIGPVDFHKTVDYWQQDKWNGCFNLKWHIVKDVPNSILKHIAIESNDNKPVTNSRDTQELKFEQGLQMLNIFKGHISRSSLLDDFGFYEARQNFMVERKSKQQQLGKPMAEIKPANAVDEKGDGCFTGKTLEPALVMKNEAVVDGQPEPQDSGDVATGEMLAPEKPAASDA